MPQSLAILLLILALVLPVVSAITLRFLDTRIDQRRLYVGAALLFGLSAAAALGLGSAKIETVRLAGLAIIVPDNGLADLPSELLPPPNDRTDLPVQATDLAIDPATSPAIPPSDSPATPASLATPIPPVEPTIGSTATATAAPPTLVPPTATSIPATALPPTPTLAPPTATAIPPTLAPQAKPSRYTIQAGDSLRAIAARFGVTVPAILRANRLTTAQADSLRPGQEIIIP
jgi:nucleoid-associated protein YgaU